MPVATPLFPSHKALAKALFNESIRHLEDASILHKAGRFPASIASSAKAAELAVKAVLVLDGASGWWNNTLSTHTPVSDIENHHILKRHFAQLQAHDPTLTTQIKLLERLAPSRSAAKGGGSQFNQQEENPEYPFLYYDSDETTTADNVKLREPGKYFKQEASLKHYATAWNTISAVTTSYTDIQAWGLAIPQPI